MAKSNRLQENDIKVQFNTRVSFRMRNSIDDYLEYMQRPLQRRPQSTESWPSNIVDIMDEALTTFFADHPRRPRKGPKTQPKRKATKTK